MTGRFCRFWQILIATVTAGGFSFGGEPMKAGSRFIYATADEGNLHCTVTSVCDNGDVHFTSAEDIDGYLTPVELVDVNEFITVVAE